ncbi:hypothetical protein KL947_002442 [Ogataea haglerorum]|nr:hypothetical protein KL947_002442 [Ogataea haglerorum]
MDSSKILATAADENTYNEDSCIQQNFERRRGSERLLLFLGSLESRHVAVAIKIFQIDSNEEPEKEEAHTRTPENREPNT